MKNRVFALPFILLLVSCGGKTEESGDRQLSFKGDSVFVNAASPVAGTIKTTEVSKEPFSSEFRTVGVATAENGKFGEVSLPFDGRVTGVYVTLGRKVRKGEPLFEIYSPEFNELVKEYYQALRTFEKLKVDYSRKQELFSHGIISKRELEELFAEYENASKDLESACSTLEVYNVNLDEVSVGQPVSILAPISGEVVVCDLTVGEYMKSDEKRPVVVADLSTMWINAYVKEHYLGHLNSNAGAEIFLDSSPDEKIDAGVFNIGSVVDSETRSVQVILACENNKRLLKHGMYVSVHFISEPKDEIVLPSSAIFQGEQHNYVYVCGKESGVFVRRRVVLGSGNDDNSRICIKSGLAVGEKVVVDGGIYLAQ